VIALGISLIGGCNASACQHSTARPTPPPWMSETIDLGKDKNFFETRVTEYQSAGALSWD
jgi:ribonucleotide reductase beta subunit family protein with ferritin-like domain